MAEDLDDGEFWLPPQFLTDDDILMEKKSFSNNKNVVGIKENETWACFPSEFPYGFDSFGSSSALSSPVESVVGSTETESDEEDYTAGLTRQMTQSMLLDHKKTIPPAFGTQSNSNSKGWALAVSPQSTLCGSWSGCSAGSSRGSPNGPSQVSSPPSTPMNMKDDSWDLLSAAAGQVVRMKMNEEIPSFHHGRGLLGPPRKPIPISAPLKNPNLNLYSNQSLTQQQLQMTQFQQLKNQQLLKQQCSSVWGKQSKVHGAQPHQEPVQYRERINGFSNGRSNRPLGLSSSAWPSLHQSQLQQPSSGMRAVFLDGSSTRKESSGTGVFLPRRVGNPADSRKKPACSTVLLPVRVVQALNLNLDDMSAQPRFNGGFAPEHVNRLTDFQIARNNALLAQQKRHIRPQPAMSHEIRLPPEWTY